MKQRPSKKYLLEKLAWEEKEVEHWSVILRQGFKLFESYNKRALKIHEAKVAKLKADLASYTASDQ